MTASSLQDLHDFRRFLRNELRRKYSYLTPQNVLEQWRQRVEMEECFGIDDEEAIRQALEDIANGDKGIPWEEAQQEIRAKYLVAASGEAYRRKTMDTTTREDIRDFHKYLGKQIRRGRKDLTPDNAIEEWRLWLKMDELFNVDDDEAIRQVLDDAANGAKWVPGEEFMREMEAKYNITRG